MNRLKIMGVAAAAVAVMLSGAQPAAAAPAEAAAAQSCRVTRWICVTPPIYLSGGGGYHLATQDLPNRAPWPAASSFILLRNMSAAGQPEVTRQYRWFGDEHDLWGSVGAAGNYRAELHCPYECPGGVLYFN